MNASLSGAASGADLGGSSIYPAEAPGAEARKGSADVQYAAGESVLSGRCVASAKGKPGIVPASIYMAVTQRNVSVDSDEGVRPR